MPCVLHAVPKGDLINGNKTKATSAFSLDLGVAEKFGFIEKPKGWSDYTLGPNLQFTCPTVTFDSQTPPPPKNPSNRTDYYWKGAHYAGTQPSDLSKDVMDIMYLVKDKRLHLSRMVKWQFNNLNASFEKVVGTSKRTAMVYSDVVESSVVGSGKSPILREVQLLSTGEGESKVEPLHHQWIKVRGHQLEMVEVEIASTSGSLAISPPGKTLVTTGLKQL